MFKSGLLSVLFVLASAIGFASCAPIPERTSSLSLVERYVDPSSQLFVREYDFGDMSSYSEREVSSVFDGRGLDNLPLLVERELGNTINEVSKRADTTHTGTTLHRRSIFSKIGHAIAHVAHKIGHGIVHAAKAVGHFIKTTGAKIAKVALKVYAAATSVAAKIVRFIPGIGTGAATALKGVSAAENLASNKIHANIGKFGRKLDHGLDAVINPAGAAAKHMGKGGKIMGALLG